MSRLDLVHYFKAPAVYMAVIAFDSYAVTLRLGQGHRPLYGDIGFSLVIGTGLAIAISGLGRVYRHGR